MNIALITLLQTVLSLLITIQTTPGIPIAERQQALSLAGQTLQIARDSLQNTPSAPPVNNPSSTTSSGGTPSTPTTTTTPSGSNTVITQTQRTVWQTCGSCGNSSGNKALATYQMKTGISNPSLSGSAAEFSIDGKGQPYANAYWYYKKLNPGAPVKYLSYSFDLYVPASSEAAIQAIEFETQQSIAGKVHNFAWQANYSGNAWRTFDYQAKRWVSTSVPFTKFSPDSWHHITSTFHVGDNGQGYHDSLVIDGKTYSNLNIRYAPTSEGNSSYLSSAFQLDTNGKGTPYKVYLDNVNLEYRI